eukprot:scaffold6208_cov64-Phaeocystis_antarctica.AAC.8
MLRYCVATGACRLAPHLLLERPFQAARAHDGRVDSLAARGKRQEARRQGATEVHANGDAASAATRACGEGVRGVAREEVDLLEAKIVHGAAVAEIHVAIRIEHDHASARKFHRQAERRHTLAAAHIEQRGPRAVCWQAQLTQHVPHLTNDGPRLSSLLAHRLGVARKEAASPVVLQRALEPRSRQQRRQVRAVASAPL